MELICKEFETYRPKNTLLAVMGLSPAIITELIFGLMQRGREHLPEQIHVITTKSGKKTLLDTYFSDSSQSPLTRMIEEYQLPPIEFPIENIHVVTGPDGSEYDDIEDDNTHDYFANHITQITAQLTQASEDIKEKFELADNQKNVNKASLHKSIKRQISSPYLKDVIIHSKSGDKVSVTAQRYKYKVHTSLAGGRKSMSFLIGYSMSLLGRTFDELSHVLVDNKVEFKECEFYYPTKNSTIMTGRNNTTFDASKININLTNIPFVNIGKALPEHFNLETITYSELINYFNVAANPHIQLVEVVGSNAHKLIISNIEIELTSEHMAFYKAITRPGNHPKEHIEFGVNKNLTEIYYAYLEEFIALSDGKKDVSITDIYDVIDAIVETSELNGNAIFKRFFGNDVDNDPDTLIEMVKKGEVFGGYIGQTQGYYKSPFADLKTKIKKKLAEYMPEQVVEEFLLPHQVDSDSGADVFRFPLNVSQVENRKESGVDFSKVKSTF